MNLDNCHLENLTRLNYSERDWRFCHSFNDFENDIDPLAQLVMALCVSGILSNAFTMFLLTVSSLQIITDLTEFEVIAYVAIIAIMSMFHNRK